MHRRICLVIKPASTPNLRCWLTKCFKRAFQHHLAPGSYSQRNGPVDACVSHPGRLLYVGEPVEETCRGMFLPQAPPRTTIFPDGKRTRPPARSAVSKTPVLSGAEK